VIWKRGVRPLRLAVDVAQATVPSLRRTAARLPDRLLREVTTFESLLREAEADVREQVMSRLEQPRGLPGTVR
jgi:hypothetical protein